MNQTTLTPDAKAWLVEALARYEAPWIPVRHHWRCSPAIQDARNVGEGGTVHWGRGEADRKRKASQRVRGGLIDQGLLTHTNRMFAAKLTPLGRRVARSWTWAFQPPEMTTAFERIRQRAAADDCLTGGYVPEPFIVGAPWGGDVGPFQELENLLLPAIADGFIEAGSTMQGQTSYRLKNVESIKAVVAFCVGDATAYDVDLGRVYVAKLTETRQQILNDNRCYTDIGPIPLPLGVSPKSDRDYGDLRGIEPLFPAAMAKV
jgi:hypothetical protein